MGRTQGLCNLGHQPGFTWAGGEADSAYKLELTYELVNLKMKDDRPFWVSEEITNTDNERGKLLGRCNAAGISIKNLDAFLDKPVMVTIEHNAKGYSKVVSVTGVPAGVDIGNLVNPTNMFDIYDEHVDLEAFGNMPEFKQEKFRNALDFDETPLAKALRVEDEEF